MLNLARHKTAQKFKKDFIMRELYPNLWYPVHQNKKECEPVKVYKKVPSIQDIIDRILSWEN